MFFIGVCMRDTPPHPILHCMPRRSGAPLHASTCTEIGKRIKAIHSPTPYAITSPVAGAGWCVMHWLCNKHCISSGIIVPFAYVYTSHCILFMYAMHAMQPRTRFKATSTLVFPTCSSVFITIPIICINGNVSISAGL